MATPNHSESPSFQQQGRLLCHCEGHCPPPALSEGLPNNTCLARVGAKCFSAVEEVYDLEAGRLVAERTYGCLPPDHMSGLLQCQGHLVPHLNPTSIACCADENYCNRHLQPTYTPTPLHEAFGMDQTTFLVLLVSVTLFLCLFVILIALAFLRYKKREDKRQKYMLTARSDPDGFTHSHPGTLNDLIEQSSGSGSGLPLLVQRTIAKQIQMERSIGKGRYGEVWLAKWRGENVAVKVFFTTDEASWFRETEIYQTVLMRHENILGFIAADIKGTGGWTQMLLITDYYENGSLYDFLAHNTLDVEQMLRICHSALCGICHLHTEIHGTRGKPAIAHRDIKTRNILVKLDGTCVIADFGLAVRYDSEKNEIDIGAPNPRVGTIRYMAPEGLDQSLNTSLFSSFLHADMYSVGLMLWEVGRRTMTGEKRMVCDESQLPYYDFVNPDPSFDEMLNAVCSKQIRPALPHRWQTSPALSGLSKVMVECWHGTPSARLSSLRVKKTLTNLLMNELPPASIKMI
ncbi:bone morphogenetic protein receptor type-1B-like [Tigriopus californicus]|uniref:bone morphogenetic protein receptor type-1B-like n=1 Tax=Tigriopus californicus TaxID=6832 RepID=UPI0027DA16BD|nr:bone morphogenetic protein receptor type-1B-like [Tigriopus californicus]